MSPVRSLHPDDTIAALASAAGSAVRGIIRISGPATRSVVESIFEALPGDVQPHAGATECGEQSAAVGETEGAFAHRVPWCYPGSLRIQALSDRKSVV